MAKCWRCDGALSMDTCLKSATNMNEPVDSVKCRLLRQLAADVCADLRAVTPHGSRLYFHLSGVLQRLSLAPYETHPRNNTGTINHAVSDGAGRKE